MIACCFSFYHKKPGSNFQRHFYLIDITSGNYIVFYFKLKINFMFFKGHISLGNIITYAQIIFFMKVKK